MSHPETSMSEWFAEDIQWRLWSGNYDDLIFGSPTYSTSFPKPRGTINPSSNRYLALHDATKITDYDLNLTDGRGERIDYLASGQFDTTADENGFFYSMSQHYELDLDRQLIQFALDDAATGTHANTNEVVFATSSSEVQKLTHLGIYDSETGGNLIFQKKLSTPLTIQPGESFSVPIGDMAISSDNTTNDVLPAVVQEEIMNIGLYSNITTGMFQNLPAKLAIYDDNPITGTPTNTFITAGTAVPFEPLSKNLDGIVPDSINFFNNVAVLVGPFTIEIPANFVGTFNATHVGIIDVKDSSDPSDDFLVCALPLNPEQPYNMVAGDKLKFNANSMYFYLNLYH